MIINLKLLFISILFAKSYLSLSVETVTEENLIKDNSIEKYVTKSKKLLLFSSMTAIGRARTLIDDLLAKNNITTILFVPYAHFYHNYSTARYSSILKNFGYEMESIHLKNDKIDAIKKSQAIFIGGGNTFALLKSLYDEKLIEPIREQVLENGIPYIGSSAGTNVATKSIHTTNDMPIVYPPTLESLNFLPFNINPHYVDSSDLISESRLYRISEFLMYNNGSVLGMRNGNILTVEGNIIKLAGTENATVIKRGNVIDYEPGSDLSFLNQMDDSQLH